MLFASSAHDAGRRLSRHQAIKLSAQTDVREKLKGKGLLVFSFSNRALQEEIPEAYKNIDDVVEATVAGGISQKVIIQQVLKDGFVTSGWCKRRFDLAYQAIYRDLSGLVELKILKPQGQGRSARYVLFATLLD